MTDSVCYLSTEEIQKHDIHVVPLQIIFADAQYKEGVDLTFEEFFDKLKSCKEMPKTSQPAIGDFVALYERLKAEGYEQGIALHVSSGISGTYQTSKMAAEMVGFNVEVIDSWMGAYPMASMLFEGIQMEKEGATVEEIVTYLRTIPPQIRSYIMVNDLELLHRGGRVSGTQYLLGSLLNIKPLVSFQETKIVSVDKVRGLKKAKARMLQFFEEAAKSGQRLRVGILHNNAQEEATAWKQEIESVYPHLTVDTANMGPVIGVHTGQGTMGICWYPTERERA
nr:DegV family protein [Brevibacillus dissolubilis]